MGADAAHCTCEPLPPPIASQFCKHQERETLKDLYNQDDNHQELGNFHVHSSYSEKVCVWQHGRSVVKELGLVALGPCVGSHQPLLYAMESSSSPQGEEGSSPLPILCDDHGRASSSPSAQWKSCPVPLQCSICVAVG